MIWYVDGAYTDSNNVFIELNNPAGLFGYGVFTTLKVQFGKLYFLKEHLTRLSSSCEFYGIPFVQAEYMNIITSLVKHNEVDSLRLRIIIRLKSVNTSQLVITAEPLVLSDSPIKVMVAPTPRELCPLNQHKTTNYMLPVYFKNKATASGYDEMLFYNNKGDVLETCFANIFFIRNRHIYTPSSAANILPGIIRSKLLQQKEIIGYKIIEKQVLLSELSEYENAFVTNSIHHLKTIACIDEFQYKPINQELLINLKSVLES